MDNFEKVLSSKHSSSPYERGLKVKVIQRREEEGRIILGFADHSDGGKGICFHREYFPKLKVGRPVLLRRFMKGRSCIMINAKTEVIPAPPLKNIGDDMVKKAEHAVNPPPPETVALKDIVMPEGRPIPINVKGQIVQDEVAHAVGNHQMVRNIRIADEGKSIPVALWNASSTSPAKNGDRVTLSHVLVKHDKFLKEIVLSTTANTNITIEEQPTKSCETDIETAEEDENGDIILTICIDDELQKYTLSQDKREMFLQGESFGDMLQNLEGETYAPELQGSTIRSISQCRPTASRKQLTF